LSHQEGKGVITDLKGKVVLVTGTNGEIGKALVKALLAKGVSKIYAAARTKRASRSTQGTGSDLVVPVKLDITVGSEVSAAVKQCGDVDVLINSAGIKRWISLPGAEGLEAARVEMEVNFFGTLDMCLAFAPVLAARGGGVMVNVCAAHLVNLPLNGKHRASLAARNIQVIRAYPGPGPAGITAREQAYHTVPALVAEAILTGMENDQADIVLVPRFQEQE
jgi:NAD(P)-dependent dehydrogenase (short-subunit alcohol dehydrogenase family)